MFKGALLVSGLSLLGLMAMTFKPVPTPTESNTYWVEGQVVSATSPCCEDIVVKLEDDPRDYTINRGMERIENASEWCAELAGQAIRLRVVKHWSPLDPSGRLRSIAALTRGDEELFSVMTK